MTDAEQIAEFLAKRGATRVPANQKALNYTRKDWHAAVRGDTPPSEIRQREREHRATSRVRMVTDHAGREFYMNEEGEWL